MESKKELLSKARKNLKDAIIEYRKVDEGNPDLKFLALSKAFEVFFEYLWKELKRKVEDEGLIANSPKESIRQGAKLGLIHSPELWIEIANGRNDSVHDYFSLPQNDYIELAEDLLKLSEDLWIFK